MVVDTRDGSTFYATLITRGRITNKPHSVKLKAVSYSGRIYFSRHRPDADWYLNAAANSDVVVGFDDDDGTTATGKAHVVCDVILLQLVSELKYKGERRAKERRVAIGVLLD